MIYLYKVRYISHSVISVSPNVFTFLMCGHVVALNDREVTRDHSDCVPRRVFQSSSCHNPPADGANRTNKRPWKRWSNPEVGGTSALKKTKKNLSAVQPAVLYLADQHGPTSWFPP